MKEFSLGGIYISPFAIHLLEAAIVFLALRWVLARSGLLARAWYLAAVELSLFTIVLSTIVALN